MSVATRLAGFVAILAVVFLVGYGIGAAFGPATAEPDDGARPGGHAEAATGLEVPT